MKVPSVLWILLTCGIVLGQPAPPAPIPMGKLEVLGRLMSTYTVVTKNERLERLVRQQGLSFNPTDDYLGFVKAAGGSEPLLDALRQAGHSAGQNHNGDLQPAAMPGDAEALEHLERGIELCDQRSYKDAAKELRTALKAEPDNIYLHLSLVTVLLFRHDSKAAVEEARRATELQPASADAHAELGHLLDSPKDPSRALPEYQQALRLEPDYASVRFRVGYIMEQQGKLDEAIEIYREGVRLAPKNAGMHGMLGDALAKKGDTVAAEEQFRLAAALPVDPAAPKRIRVGGQVMAKKLIFSQLPVYPPQAKAGHLTGTVRLSVLIRRDGSVANVTVLSGNPLLAQAAADSVRNWRYRPIFLSGVPVEVLTEVDINFN